VRVRAQQHNAAQCLPSPLQVALLTSRYVTASRMEEMSTTRDDDVALTRSGPAPDSGTRADELMSGVAGVTDVMRTERNHAPLRV